MQAEYTAISLAATLSVDELQILFSSKKQISFKEDTFLIF